MAFAAGSAWAQPAVTSATSGEPPAQQAAGPARILSFGTDIQAGQRVTTGAQERAHLVFADGTSLTVGPNGALVVEKYAYDPQRRTGEMTLNAAQGAFRFVGGAISKNADVTIKTPSATIGMRGGIATFAVSENGATTADFLHGFAMRVTGQGTTQTATRNGSQITVAAGGPPTQPTLLQSGQLRDNTIPPAAAGRPAKSSIDDALAKSELAKHNSGLASQQVLATDKFPVRDPIQQGRVLSPQELARTAGMTATAASPTIVQQPLAIRPTIAASASPIGPLTSTVGVVSPGPTVTAAGGATAGGAVLTKSGTGTLTISNGSLSITNIGGGTITSTGSGTITGTGGAGGTTIIGSTLTPSRK